MVGEATLRRDAVAYIRANLDFHRTLYLRAQHLRWAMAETVGSSSGQRCGPFTAASGGPNRRTITD